MDVGRLRGTMSENNAVGFPNKLCGSASLREIISLIRRGAELIKRPQTGGDGDRGDPGTRDSIPRDETNRPVCIFVIGHWSFVIGEEMTATVERKRKRNGLPVAMQARYALIEQAAELIGCSIRTVHRLKRAGQLTAITYGERGVAISRASISLYVAQFGK